MAIILVWNMKLYAPCFIKSTQQLCIISIIIIISWVKKLRLTHLDNWFMTTWLVKMHHTDLGFMISELYSFQYISYYSENTWLVFITSLIFTHVVYLKIYLKEA